MNLKIGSFFLLICWGFSLKAQDSGTHENHHDHHRHEIGLANSLVFIGRESEWALGIHAHYLYHIPHTRFGAGLAYERIFDGHGHNMMGIAASYRPLDRITINVTPGIAFSGKEHPGTGFALHFEITYEFQVDDFHLGPSVEYAYEPDGYHISTGIHLGIGF